MRLKKWKDRFHTGRLRREAENVGDAHVSGQRSKRSAVVHGLPFWTESMISVKLS